MGVPKPTTGGIVPFRARANPSGGSESARGQKPRGVSGGIERSAGGTAKRPAGTDRLSDAACRSAKPDADGGIRKLSDGKGLYLAVLPSGVKSWRMKYRHDGKEKTYTIGEYDEIGLAEARRDRDEARGWLRDGKDPTAEKRARKAATSTAQANTFAAVAADYLGRQSFTAQHVEALNRILERDLLPELGAIPIGEITTPQVLAALRTIEDRGQLETCAKARRFASQVFRYAIATGIGASDPAATLSRGVLKPPVVVNRVTVPLKEFPALLKALGNVPAELNTRAACYWTLLTACRVGEMRLATWAEIDGGEWIIPAERMKMRRDHVVPLSKQARDVLKAATSIRTSPDAGALLFPGFTRHGALSENALIALLARCGFYGRQTAHGFRAAFSTWAHEKANAHPDVIEACLAHVIPGVRGKYNRAAYLPQRRELLQQWADQLTKWGLRLP
jgi:integrase